MDYESPTCTEHATVIKYREVSGEVLRILNDADNVALTLERIIVLLRTQLVLDAVGIRLQEGEDFPYYSQQGFTADFLRTENSLVERNAEGGICRNQDNSPRLECTCGMVLSGKTDPSHALFTRGGSCLVNNSFPLLRLPAAEDPRLNPRNRCIHQGHASVALVPIRNKDKIIGLIQLNDRAKGRFTLECIEIIEGMAANIGAALMRKQAESALQRAHDELEQKVAERTEALRIANEDLRTEMARRQQVELEKAAAEAHNRQLQKSESLSRMAAAVAHHFNNQLQAVMMSLEMAASGVAQNAEAAAGLAVAKHAARSAARVSNLMLTYLGKSHAPHQRLDFAAACREGLERLAPSLPPNLRLETELPSPGPIVNASAEQIHEAIGHLVTNAQEASRPEAAPVRIRVRTVAAAEIADRQRFPVDFRPEARTYACLEVADQGGGVARADIEKLFDPFYSTKFTGRGMGLPVVLGIARAHDGAVTVDSTPNLGSIFRIFFPV